MTIPSVKTVMVAGSRWYVDPTTGEKVPGVTSIIDVLNKPALVPWAAKMAAEYAVNNLSMLTEVAKSDKFAAIDLIKNAHKRRSGAAADQGTGVHGYVERLMVGERGFSVQKDAMPFLRNFADFQQEFGARSLRSEQTLWNTQLDGYAGTCDGIWFLDALPDPGPYIIDVKTGGSGIYPEAALQLSAYQHAEYMMNADGTREDMVSTAGSFALWLRPTGWALIPLDTGQETFDTFLHLREAFVWTKTRKDSSVGAAINKRPLTKPKWGEKR